MTAAPPTGDQDELWAGLVRFIKGKRPALAYLLEEVHPLKVSAELVEIGCPLASFQFKTLQDPEKVEELKAFAASFFGAPSTVRVVPLTAAGSDAPVTLSEKKSLEDAERRVTLRKEAEEHPLVARAVEIFDGEIAEVQELPPDEM